MRVRRRGEREACGWSSEFNVHALGEVIVQFDEGDADSEFIRDYEVLTRRGWVSLTAALSDGLLAVDDLNTRFYEPKEET